MRRCALQVLVCRRWDIRVTAVIVCAWISVVCVCPAFSAFWSLPLSGVCFSHLRSGWIGLVYPTSIIPLTCRDYLKLAFEFIGYPPTRIDDSVLIPISLIVCVCFSDAFIGQSVPMPSKFFPMIAYIGSAFSRGRFPDHSVVFLWHGLHLQRFVSFDPENITQFLYPFAIFSISSLCASDCVGCICLDRTFFFPLW